ncbi:hypothetical protein NicSoilB8_24510 [Arthrobacter sp. NicSoilB8]|nr:hypothetical protein NicSoilB8_24510 [Arthrobacter sp. NicSoilB8]
MAIAPVAGTEWMDVAACLVVQIKFWSALMPAVPSTVTWAIPYRPCCGQKLSSTAKLTIWVELACVVSDIASDTEPATAGGGRIIAPPRAMAAAGPNNHSIAHQLSSPGGLPGDQGCPQPAKFSRLVADVTTGP